MKVLLAILLMIAVVSPVASAQTTPTDNTTVAGKWSGSFDGDSSGKFEMVLNQDSSGKLTGQVIMVTDDGSRYPIDLKTAVWEKGQLTATYENPSDGGQVSFTGKFADSDLKGTWQTNAGQASGMWQASRAN
ncbi:hypothetical protein WBJ53_30365 [Spirosoma sp. SC4-14]|uniref:hypothetical protein n=1 Tax=Spirosoma sp. SC4-14 TaxID=3128900 RepID=UPI0030D34B8D